MRSKILSFDSSDLTSWLIDCKAIHWLFDAMIVWFITMSAGFFSSPEQCFLWFQYKEKAYKSHPLGRLGRVDDVAEAIAFLASEKASFLTGTLIPVDGGRHATCAMW